MCTNSAGLPIIYPYLVGLTIDCPNVCAHTMCGYRGEDPFTGDKNCKFFVHANITIPILSQST